MAPSASKGAKPLSLDKRRKQAQSVVGSLQLRTAMLDNDGQLVLIKDQAHVTIKVPRFEGGENIILKHVAMPGVTKGQRWEQVMNEVRMAPVLASAHRLVGALDWTHTARGLSLAFLRPGSDTLAEAFAKLNASCVEAGLAPEAVMAARVERLGPILLEMMLALNDLHTLGCLHRDGKASNWVMDSRDASRPLLIDFGLAQRIADGMGCAEGFTSSHAPPEYLLAMERHGQWSWRRQRRGAPAGEPLPCGGVLELLRVTLGTATDVYLLGATLWEVLFPGYMPYIGALSAYCTERAIVDAIIDTPTLTFPPGPQPPEPVKPGRL